MRTIEGLLEFLCVRWGFCLSPDEQKRIEFKVEWSAEEFAISVLKAEGFNPEYESKWVRRIKEKFTEYFGSDHYSKT